MKPPMNQKLFIKSVRSTDENGEPLTDRFGRDIFEDYVADYPARVRRKINRISRSDGILKDTDIEIDTVNEAPVEADMDIEFTDIDGVRHKGTILGITDSTNFAGTRAYFKVLMVDGK